MCCAQSHWQFTPKSCARIDQGRQRARCFRHTHKCPVVFGGNILVVVEQNLVDWSVVSGQINHKALDHAVGDA